MTRTTQGQRVRVLLATECIGWLALTADAAWHGPVTRWEERLARQPRRPPTATYVVSRAGAPRALRAGLLLVSIGRARRSLPVFAPLVRVVVASELRRQLSWLVSRRRPPQSWWHVEPDGWSYPSRHTTNAALLVRFASNRRLAGRCRTQPVGQRVGDAGPRR